MGLFDFLKKKSANRYDEQPFLKLVDSFVLKCIDHLDQNQEEIIKEMEPKLQATYNSNGTWDEIVMKELELEPSIINKIRKLWAKNQEIARQNNVELLPINFTEMFVDSNIRDSVR